MRVKALVNFSGAISMAKGEERDIKNNVLLKDLLQAGYVKSLESENEILEDEDSTDESVSPEPDDETLEGEYSTDENATLETENEEQEVATSQKQPSKRGVKSNESK